MSPKAMTSAASMPCPAHSADRVPASVTRGALISSSSARRARGAGRAVVAQQGAVEI
ncbi:hypothetical protein [Streptomyces sp. NBC_01260]|uniref:hypothetical protein n=1 Tax=Streptomyces sp. NBC_01260 TaxID=2903801 RepID=UPI003FCDD48E